MIIKEKIVAIFENGELRKITCTWFGGKGG